MAAGQRIQSAIAAAVPLPLLQAPRQTSACRLCATRASRSPPDMSVQKRSCRLRAWNDVNDPGPDIESADRAPVADTGFRTIQVRPKDRRPRAARLLMRQTACARRFLPAMIGGGTWEGAHARHEAAGVRQPARRRGGGVAARGARAAAGDAGGRLSWKSYGARPTRAAICLRCTRTVKAPRSKATAGLLKLTRSVSHLRRL